MNRAQKINRLIGTAVLLGLMGLSCLFLFLLVGFQPWSVGIGIFLGFPLVLISIILYVIAVVVDLKRHDVVTEETHRKGDP